MVAAVEVMAMVVDVMVVAAVGVIAMVVAAVEVNVGNSHKIKRDCTFVFSMLLSLDKTML